MRARALSRTHRLLIAIAAGAALCVTIGNAQTPNPAEADSLIYERQQLMEHLENESDALGDIVAGLQPPDKLAETSRGIAKTARESVEAFGKVVPGGRSKPEVWSNHADFIKRMQDFATKADAMAKLAESGDIVAVTAMMPDALPCKGCHDIYREPKRK